MLHWNSWWVQRGQPSRHGSGEPPLMPSDPAAWTPEGWLAWQFNLWNRSWEASLAWWRLYGVTVPGLAWPATLAATTIVQPPDETPTAPQLAADSVAVPLAIETAPKRRPRAISSRRSDRVIEQTPSQPPP